MNTYYEKKYNFYIKDLNTQTEEVQKLTHAEVAILKKNRPKIYVQNIETVLKSFKNFKAVFTLYNEQINLRTTNKFITILEHVYNTRAYKIDPSLVAFIKSYKIENYLEMMPEEFYARLMFDKDTYMSLIKFSDDTNRSIFFQQLKRIPEIKMKIEKTVNNQLKILLAYVSIGSVISYAIITQVIPRIAGINHNVSVDLSKSYAIMYSMWFIIAFIITGRALFSRFKVQFIKTFYNFPLIGDIITGLNFIDLLMIFLVGQFSNVSFILPMYNKAFPYIAYPDNIGSRKSLIGRIMGVKGEQNEARKYFNISGLVVLDSINERSTEEIMKTIQEQAEAYANTLEENTKVLSIVIRNIGLVLIAISILAPCLALISITMGISNAIQATRG